MFANRITLTLQADDGAAPVPKAWLDQFFLRSFTGSSAFDHTLPVADGVLEAGFGVQTGEIQAQLETWLRGRKMIPPSTRLAATLQSGV